MANSKQKKVKESSEDVESQSTVKRKRRSKSLKIKPEKRVTREQKIEVLKMHAREYECTYRPNVIDLKKNPEECRRATEGTCLRPDIYLNNDRTCDTCIISENCACILKRFSNRKTRDTSNK